MSPPENSRIRIRIEDGALTAHVAVGAGPAQDRAALDAALAEAGIAAGVRTAPVVEQGEHVGVLTFTDVLNSLRAKPDA